MKMTDTDNKRRVETLDEYFPKNIEEIWEYNKSPSGKIALAYIEEVYDLERVFISSDKELEIIAKGAAIYDYNQTKWLTNGGDISATHEVCLQAMSEYIDSTELSEIFKKDE